MNKYTLGTIFGTAALGFIKKTRSIGSQIKLKRKQYSFFEVTYFASTKLINWDGEAENLENEFPEYPGEYWDRMDSIVENYVKPQIIKETFIDALGLSTYLRLEISMQPYDDGDPDFQPSILYICFNVEEDSPFFKRNKLIQGEIESRYGEEIFEPRNPIFKEVFLKHGINYSFSEYGDGLSGPWASFGTFDLNFIENDGKWVPYFPSTNNISKLRKR